MWANSRQASAEKYWRHTMEVLEDNLVLMLMVLREEYGFGEKRIDNVITAVRNKAKQFEEMSDDEVLDIRTADIRAAYHEAFREIVRINAKALMPPETYEYFFNTPLPMHNDIRRTAHLQEKIKSEQKKVSLKEATELHSFMQAAQGYLKNEGYQLGGNRYEV
ncbi:MAG: hypothetical protein IJ368_03545 [Oscillospiraceae bacterium]|nr:hypothetical protein [Oscillospiraceae bacterium]